MELTNEKEACDIDFRDLIFDGANIWVSMRKINGLIKIKWPSLEVIYMEMFPDSEIDFELHSTAIQVDERMIFIPALGNTVHIFDAKKELFSNFRLGCKNMEWNFLDAVRCGNKIVIFPLKSSAIYCYDLKQNSIKEIFDLYEKGLTRSKKAEGMCCHGSLAVRKDSIFAAVLCYNRICEFEVEKEAIRWHSVGNNEYAFSTILNDGVNFWMAAEGDLVIVKWNPDTKDTKYYKSFPNNLMCREENRIPFCNLVDCGDKILAVAFRANMSLWIDKESGELTECEILGQENLKQIDPLDFGEYRLAKKMEDNKILLLSCRDNAIVIYNFITNKVERRIIKFTQAELIEIMIRLNSSVQDTYMFREEIFGSQTYLKYINSRENVLMTDESKISTEINSQGGKIHNYVLNELRKTVNSK